MSTELFEKVFTITKGKKVSNVFAVETSPSLRYIQIDDLRNDSNLKYTDEFNLVTANPNDIIIAWDGANAGTVGFGLEGVIGSTLAKLKIRDEFSNKFETDYLGYFLKSKSEYLRSKTTGAAIPHLSRNSLETIEIPVLPMQVQRQIASALSKAEAIVVKRKESLKVIEKLLKDIFLFMFGDPGVNPHHYPLVTFNEVYEQTQYGTNSKASEVNEGIPILRMNNITYEGFIDLTDLKWITMTAQEKDKYSLRNRDLLFNRTNSRDLVGKAAVWNHGEGYTFAGYLVRIRFDESEINPFYASAFLNSRYGKQLLYNSVKLSNNMTNISPSLLGELTIPKPPIELQNEFEKLYSIVFSKRDAIRKSLILCNNLFQSLLQRAFHGDISFDVNLQLNAFIESMDYNSISNDKVLMQRLIDRINQLKIEPSAPGKQFESLKNYENIRVIIFELLNLKRVMQVFDKESKQTKLELA